MKSFFYASGAFMFLSFGICAICLTIHFSKPKCIMQGKPEIVEMYTTDAQKAYDLWGDLVVSK